MPVSTDSQAWVAIFDVGIKLFTALLTPVIATIAAFIAYRQHRTASDNLRLALFDRRYQVYRGLMDLFAEVSTERGETIRYALGKFFQDTDQKRFLFKADIVNYLTEVRMKAGELLRLCEAIEGRPKVSEEDFNSLVERKIWLGEWFSAEIEQAQMRFEPYLGFHHKL